MRLRPRALLRQSRSWLQRRQRRRQVPHAAVLMYHRIASVATDPWDLCVSPGHFDEQLHALRRFADIVPLTELRSRMAVGRAARPVIALTFDDGYRDNLDAAKPILERHAAPATVFLVTDNIEQGEPFWWDRLASIVYAPAPLPAQLRLVAPEPGFAWHDAALARSSDPRDPARRRLLQALWAWLVALPRGARNSALVELARQAGDPPGADPSTLPMTPAQVRSLLTGGLVQAGAHTVSHVRLPDLSAAEQLAEIADSREACARLTGELPDCFSYPFGELDPVSRDCVRQAGFALACTSDPNIAWADGDALLVPRLGVRDGSGAALARMLRWYWFA